MTVPAPEPQPIAADWESFYANYRKPGYIPGYEITSKLGGGMFGLVFRARKQSIGKDYAIKFLKVDDTEVRRAVLLELEQVRYFAQIDHPNLVSIEDKGEVDGIPFLVMNFAGTETLKDRLPAQGADRDEVLRCFLQACRGVSALHERSLVHFDLKPANIFLKGGVARVGDYGLSKLVTHSRGSLSMGRGTPYYMAPEMLQRRGDHRSDIYSLGVILYECLCGDVPFKGDSEWEVLRKHEKEAVVVPDHVPAAHRAALQRCLAKDPAARFGSVLELMAAFGAPTGAGAAMWHDVRNGAGASTATAAGTGPAAGAGEAPPPPLPPGDRPSGSTPPPLPPDPYAEFARAAKEATRNAGEIARRAFGKAKEIAADAQRQARDSWRAAHQHWRDQQKANRAERKQQREFERQQRRAQAATRKGSWTPFVVLAVIGFAFVFMFTMFSAGRVSGGPSAAAFASDVPRILDFMGTPSDWNVDSIPRLTDQGLVRLRNELNRFREALPRNSGEQQLVLQHVSLPQVVYSCDPERTVELRDELRKFAMEMEDGKDNDEMLMALREEPSLFTLTLEEMDRCARDQRAAKQVMRLHDLLANATGVRNIRVDGNPRSRAASQTNRAAVQLWRVFAQHFAPSSERWLEYCRLVEEKQGK